MKSGKLLDAIGMVGDDLIDEARAPQKKVIQWKHWTAIAACLAVLIGILAIAKVIEFVFNKFPLYAYWAIIGLIVASPFAIVLGSL